MDDIGRISGERLKSTEEKPKKINIGKEEENFFSLVDGTQTS